MQSDCESHERSSSGVRKAAPAAPPVGERNRRARVAETRSDRVEHERGLLVEALRGEQLRRHLEEELVPVNRQAALGPRGQGLNRMRSAETVLHTRVVSGRWP